MKMKRIFALLLALVMVFALTACGSSSDSGSDSTDESASASGEGGADVGDVDLEDLTIAFLNVTDSLAPWPQYIKEDFQAICDANGWTLIGYDGQGDVNTQTDEVASVISDGEADLALLFSVSSDSGVQYVQDLTDAGIPVITFGSDVSEDGRSNVKCYVGVDQELLVDLSAEYAISQEGDGAKYICLSGFEGQYDYIARSAETTKVFDEAGYELLGDINYCGAARSEAADYATTLLNQYGDEINFIFCHSDEFALGAKQAVEEAGLTGKVHIYSMETFAETLPDIEDGTISSSVTMTSQAVADKLGEVIPQVMSGESVEYDQSIDQVLVTAENAAEYDGALQY